MTRTLDKYLGRDLVKSTGLATLAFTVVLTILAVIEPLRSQGLTGAQAIKLFAYLLPVMFSLTLPVAALFAATIVYGRFAQDNELMACRASGICTLTLMRPAIILGLVVGLCTLALGLYVAPALIRFSEANVKNQLEPITYQQLKSKGYINLTDQSRLFHADEVDYENREVRGVVLVEYDNKGTADVLVASSARMEFPTVDGRTSVVFHFTDPVMFQQAGGSMLGEDEQPFRVLELPGMPDDKPRFYSWQELWRTWRTPTENRSIVRRSREIRRKVAVRMFLRDVGETISTTGRYDRLVKLTSSITQTAPKRLEIIADGAWLDESVLRLGSAAASGTASPVVVREGADGKIVRELEAASGSIRGSWQKHEPEALISVHLQEVDVRSGVLTEQTLRLAELRGRPVGLIFGSYT